VIGGIFQRLGHLAEDGAARLHHLQGRHGPGEADAEPEGQRQDAERHQENTLHHATYLQLRRLRDPRR
jgi:hypothetical protein